MNFGNISLGVPFFQASLSGYSDYAMRKLALRFGSPLVFAGVMLAKSAAQPGVLRKTCFRPFDDEHPIGAQILGNEPAVMAKAAKALVKAGYDLIDLNFACPAPKVLRRGRGGALLKEPEKVIKIYRVVREAVDCPVLMKLRAGFDGSKASLESFWEIASRACDEGIDGLIVHGRTVSKKYRGQADWKILGELKKKFPQTTVIGSGDLFDAESVFEIVKTAGVDGFVIARGAIGNPWIFGQLRAMFEGKAMPPSPDLYEQGQVILEHFEMVSRLYKGIKAVRYFRKFLVHYCKIHPKRKKVQQILLAAENRDEVIAGIKQWYQF